MAKRKRRTQAEMAKARDLETKNGKLREKVKNGELDDRALLMENLPKEEKTKIVYVKEPYPVIQEVRVLTDAQGTKKTVTEIVREEVGKVKIWEYKSIPINTFSVKDLPKLGKEGWKYAFDLSPEITHSVKVTTLIFQRPK